MNLRKAHNKIVDLRDRLELNIRQTENVQFQFNPGRMTPNNSFPETAWFWHLAPAPPETAWFWHLPSMAPREYWDE